MLFDPPPPVVAPDARRRPLDNPRVLIVIALLLIGLLVGLFWLSSRTSEIPLQLSGVDAVFGPRRRPAAAGHAVLRARAQPRQALGRPAAGGAVRSVPGEARRRAARDDDPARGTRPPQRQRDHSRVGGALVQRARRSAARVRAVPREPLLPGSSGSHRQRDRTGWRARCRPRTLPRATARSSIRSSRRRWRRRRRAWSSSIGR